MLPAASDGASGYLSLPLSLKRQPQQKTTVFKTVKSAFSLRANRLQRR